MAMIELKKSPQQKKETAACGSACLRAAAPPSSLASLHLLPLPLAAAPPHTLSSCLSFTLLLWRLRRHPFCPLRASLASCGRLRRPEKPLHNCQNKISISFGGHLTTGKKKVQRYNKFLTYRKKIWPNKKKLVSLQFEITALKL